MTDAEKPEELEPGVPEPITVEADATEADVVMPRRKSRWLRRTAWGGGVSVLVLVVLLVMGFFWASSAGFEEMVRVRVVTPVPLHSSQGCSMIDPLPRHSAHGSEKPKAP